MNKAIKASAIYIMSGHGENKNYIKSLNTRPNGEVQIEFTREINDVYPFEDSKVQGVMKMLAMPFIQNLMKNGKTEQEIFDWTTQNIGSDSIDVNISSGEESE
jgi:hypothetical protein